MMQARRNGEAAMQMGSSRRRTRRNYNNNNDYPAAAVDQSWFPHEIVDRIIKFMPVNQAARMSVLSTAFKHTWKKAQNLIFDETFSTNRDELQVIEAVYKVLENHSGIGIKKFHLYIYATDDIEEKIEECMDILALMQVEEIDLDLDNYSLSDGLLNARFVGVLKLKRVIFDYSPVQISGLSNLTTLVLKKVDFDDEISMFEHIIAQCLKLEMLEISHCRRIPFLRISASKHESFGVLKIDNCKKLSQIDISAPSLGLFYYHGCVLKIHFLGSHPKLDNVVTTFVRPEVSTTQFESKYFLEDVQGVRVLSINSALLEGLCSNLTAATELGFKLRNLTELQVHFEGSNDSDPYDVAILAVNSPRLERLYIDLGNYNFESRAYSQKVHLFQQNHYFENLKLLVVKGYKSQICEADMVRDILLMASSIATVALVTPRNYSYSRNEMIFHLYPWKPTPRMKFKIHDYGKYREVISPAHDMKAWWWNRKNND